jgi:nitrogen fixation protein NifU and related proteins
MYSDKVMQLFKKAKHAKEMKNPDAVGEEGNVKCGDKMKVFIKVKKDKNGKEILSKVNYQTFGCVSAIACSEAVAELAEGQELTKAKNITPKQIAEHLDGLPPIKFHCSILGHEALKKAIENHQKKH